MFKQRRLRSTTVLTAIFGKVAEVQRNCSDFLNRKTRRWNRRQQKCFLFIVCMVMGGLSTLSLVGIRSSTYTEGVKGSTIVAPVIRPSITPNNVTGSIYHADTPVFYRFYKALDSLQQTPEGRKAYENYLRQHPGFLDSLANAEKSIIKIFPY